jgi:hypothetical protein
VLAQHGGVGVVGHEDRQAGGLGEPGGQRGVGPREVGGVDDRAVGAHDPGATDADAEHGALTHRDELGGETQDELDRALPHRPVDVHLVARLDGAGEVDHGAGHPVRLRQVEADHVVGVRRQADERRGLADPAPCRGSELGDEAVGEHLADQVRHGHPGQPARAGEVGTAGRTLAEEVLEEQRAVVAARVLLEELAGGTQRAADGSGRGHIS